MVLRWLLTHPRKPAHPAARKSAPRFRPGVSEMEARLAPATRLFAGLQFDAPVFTDTASSVTAAGVVQVGKDPAGGTFQPLLKLANGVQFSPADAAGSFATAGAVVGVAGGQSQQLLDAGEAHTLTAPALLGGGLALPAGESDGSGFGVAGMTFKLGSVRLGDNAVTLQGSVSAPALAGLTLAVTGSDAVTVGTGGVKLTGLDVTTASPLTFSRSGIRFTAGPVHARYSAAADRFELTGSASLTAAGNTVSLDLGTAASPGLVVQSGDLLSLDATITTPTFTVGGLSLGLTNARTQFDKANNRFALTGTADFALAGNAVRVILDGDGLVVRDNAVVGIDAAVSGAVKIGGLSFTADALKLTMPEGGSTLAVTGTGTIAFAGQTVGITLGVTGAAGVVIDRATGGLLSLDAAVTSDITLGGLKFTSTGLGVEYRAATTDIRVKGKAAVTLPGGSGTADFGTAGIVVAGGQFVGLDASVTGQIGAGGLAVALAGVRVKYATADGSGGDVSVSGTASVAVAGKTVSIALGTDAAPGVVIRAGVLQSLSAAVTADVAVAGLTLKADQLKVDYTAPSTVRITGKTTFALAGSDPVALDLGASGVYFAGGALKSLDASLTGGFKAGGLTVTAKALALAWADGGAISVSGTAGFALAGNTVSVTLGTAAAPGLVLSAGTLQSLDATVDSNIALGGLTFTAAGMRVKYRAATADVQVSGTSTVTLPGGNTATVTFGDGATAGVVVQGGQFVSLNATVSGKLGAGGLTLTADALKLAYTSGSVQVSGTAGFALGGNTVSVTLGSDGSPGVLLTNGALTALDATVTSNISVGGLTLTASGVRVKYRAATADVQVYGTSTVTLPGGSSATVSLNDAGLVVTGGKFASLDATVSGQLGAGGLAVTLAGVRLKYASADGTTSGGDVSVSGTASVAVAGKSVSIALGTDAAPGLVIRAGALQSLSASVSTDITVGAVTLQAAGLRVDYAAPSTVRVTGKTSFALAGSGAVAVDLGTSGVYFAGGTLTSFNASVTGGFKAGGLTVTAKSLAVAWDAAGNKTAVSGTASFALAGNTVSVTLGTAAAPGLVLSAGTLQSLNATVDSNIALGGLTFTSTGLQVAYRATSGDIRIGGTSTLALPGGTASAAVTFAAADGLVIQNGSLKTLNATLSGNLKAGGLSVSLTAVSVSYSGSDFTLKGAASFTLPSQTGPVTITLGSAADSGLVLKDGAVQSLAATVSTTGTGLTVAGLTFAADGMGVKYRAAQSDIQITGKAKVTLPGGSGTAAVDFGTSGVVIQGGSLVSLDAAVNGTLKAGGLTVTLVGAAVSYTSVGGNLSLKGTASFLAAGRTVSIRLGTADGKGDGVVIQSGVLTTLNAAVTADLTFGGVAIKADALGVQYKSADGTRVAITGTARVALPGGSFAAVQLGTAANPGLVFDNGTLTSLSLGVTSEFKLKGLTFGTRDLTVGWTAAAGSAAEALTIGGALYLSAGTAGGAQLASVNATVGTAASPGLVIEGGDLKSLDITLNAGFDLYGVAVTVDSLHVTYASTTGVVRITGGASVKVASIGGSVSFPAAAGGLTIDTATGAVVVNGLDLAFSTTVGSFAADLHVAFSGANGAVTVSGYGGVTVTGIGRIGANFSVVNSQLTSIGLYYSAGTGSGIQIAATPFYVTYLGAKLTGLASAATVQFDGTVDVTLGRTVSLGGTNYNILTARGSLSVNSDRLVIGGSIWLLAYSTGMDQTTGLLNYDSKLGKGTATVTLNWAAGLYSASVSVNLLDSAFVFGAEFLIDNGGNVTISGTAHIKVPASVPLIGGTDLGGVGFYVQIRPGNASQTYGAAWFTIDFLHASYGFKYGPSIGASLIDTDDINQLTRQIPGSLSTYIAATNTYETVVKVRVPVELTDGFTAVVSSPALAPGGKLSDPAYGFYISTPFFHRNQPNITGYANYGTFSYGTVSASDTKATYNALGYVYTAAASDNTKRVVRLPDFGKIVPYNISDPIDPTDTYDYALDSAMREFDLHLFSKQALILADIPSLTLTPVMRNAYTSFDTYSGGMKALPDGGFHISLSAYSYVKNGLKLDDTGTKVSLYYSTKPPGQDSGSKVLIRSAYLGDTTQLTNVSSSTTTHVNGYSGGEWSFDWADFAAVAYSTGTYTPLYLSAVIDDRLRTPITNYFDGDTSSYPLIDPIPALRPNPTVTAPAYAPIQNGILLLGTQYGSAVGISSLVAAPTKVQVLYNGEVLGTLSGSTAAAVNATLSGSAWSVSVPAAFPTTGVLTVRGTTTVGGRDFVTDQTIIGVRPNNHLQLLASTTNSSPKIGQTVTVSERLSNLATFYSLTATNAGASFSFPAGLTLVSATASQGSYSAATGRWTAGTIVAGQSVTLDFVLRVDAGPNGGSVDFVRGTASAPGSWPLYDPGDAYAGVMLWAHRPISVTTPDDTASASDGLVSLREALTWANDNIGDDTILLTGLSGTLSVVNALPTVVGPLTLTGPGAGVLTARQTGGVGVRFLDVASTATVSGLTVTNFGVYTGNGGAILVEAAGDLTLNGVNLVGNRAAAGAGGAVANFGRLTASDDLIQGNTATGVGGGVYIGTTAKSTVLSRTAVVGNVADGAGGAGGGVCQDGGQLITYNTTIGGNTATWRGGGLAAAGGTASLNSLTLTGNSASVAGGLLVLNGVVPNLVSTIIAGNTGGDVSGAVSGDHSLVGSAAGMTGLANGVGGNRVGVDPKLGALGYYGGPTPAYPLQAGSPALNAGAVVDPYSDQRGTGFARAFGTAADIGAFEAQQGDTSLTLNYLPPLKYTNSRLAFGVLLANAATAPVAVGLSGTVSLPAGVTPLVFYNLGSLDFQYTAATGVWRLNSPLAAGQSVQIFYEATVTEGALIGGTGTLPIALTLDKPLQPANARVAATLPLIDPTPLFDPATGVAPEDGKSARLGLTSPSAGLVQVDGVTGGRLVSGASGAGSVPSGSQWNATDLFTTTGLYFLPDPDSNTADGGQAGFFVQAFESSTSPVGRRLFVPISVTSVNDAPTVSAPATLAVLSQSGSQTLAGFAGFSPGPTNEGGQGVAGYTVAVTGNPGLFAVAPAVAADGTLSYTLAAGAVGTATFTVRVRDTGGTANGGVDLSAPVTVTLTAVPAPGVAGLVVNDGSVQRSRVTALTVTFNTEVALDAGAIRLTRPSDGAAVGEVQVTTALSAGRTVATLTFLGANTDFGSLADGVWTLAVDRTKVRTAAGSFAPAADLVQAGIKRLFGDGTGDAAVLAADYTLFQAAYGKASTQAGYTAAFDFNADGVVNGADLAQFRLRVNRTLP